MVAERRDLVAHTLQRVTEPATINNKATSDGVASGFVADKFNVHINRVWVNFERQLKQQFLSRPMGSNDYYRFANIAQRQEIHLRIYNK